MAVQSDSGLAGSVAVVADELELASAGALSSHPTALFSSPHTPAFSASLQ